jgi:ABC-2 type transport system permease protein
MQDSLLALPSPQQPPDEEISRALSLQGEARVFNWLRRRMFLSHLRQMLTHSRLRLSLVVFLTIFFWGGLFALFTEGFQFLNRSIGHMTTHAQTVQAIYNVFFASLMLMLVLSSAIILYTGLYRSPEASLLLTMPVRPERIVLFKFQEALLFSSWGFLLLGSPMLVAYGIDAGAPWYYYVLLLPLMVAFVYIPGAVGSILCLVIVHRWPRLKGHLLGAGILALAALIIAVAWMLLRRTENNLLTPLWFQELLSRLQFSEHRLLPSWWLSSGLLEAANGASRGFDYQPWSESLMFLALLTSNALLCHVAMTWVAAKTYRPGFSEMHTQQAIRRPRKLFWFDQLIMRWLPLLPQSVRLLIVKDLRQFRRDPIQWSQFLIFFSLLALYFFNIRRFSYDINYAAWVNMISFLNLAVVGLILSTFTTRFIFPMISLEGQRFWILGLLPVQRDAVLWSKFLFAAGGAVIPCTALIFVSDVMLGISGLMFAMHQLTCLMLCLGLSGIAVGLGAKMPDLRELSSSKIAAGFGGTLTLVFSAMYIVGIVLIIAVPCHFYLLAQQVGSDRLESMRLLLLSAAAAALLLGAIVTYLPMRSGLKAFRAMEF